jgi:hypothetical protein
MRTLILIAGVALALAACRNNDAVDNTSNVSENLSAENMVSNDVTAIDAVTGDDANMAADVVYNDDGLDNGVTDLNTPTANAEAPPPRKAPHAKTAAPTSTPAETNSATNATTNAE